MTVRGKRLSGVIEPGAHAAPYVSSLVASWHLSHAIFSRIHHERIQPRFYFNAQFTTRVPACHFLF